MVVGCPMATSDVTCMPDRVGDAALVFDPYAVDQIAECMRRLWTDDRLCDELSRKGKERGSSWGQPQFNARFLDIVSSIIAPETDRT